MAVASITEQSGRTVVALSGEIDMEDAPKVRRALLDSMKQKATLLKENGATRVVDAWGDDVPDGKITDYKGAVKAESGETVVYSWVEWPSKEIRDAAWEKLMSDPRMQPDQMPFDGKRMIYGGFQTMLDE